MTIRTIRPIVLPALAALAFATYSAFSIAGSTEAGGKRSATPPAAANAPATGDAGAHRCDGHGRNTPAALLRRFDANQDGKLELGELPGRMRHRLGAADTNKDGVLGVDELAAHRTAEVKARFARKDRNGDGALTADEVGAGRWKHLRAADTDGNGRGTLPEIDQALAKGALRGPRRGFKHGHHGSHPDEPSPAPSKS